MAMATQKLTAGQAARFIGVSTQRIWLWGNDGRLTYTIEPVSGWRVYDLTDVERLAAAREERAKRQRQSA